MELVVIVEGEAERRLRLDPAAEVTLGRGGDNLLPLQDNLVSRRHARIHFDGGWQVEDLGSRNGTRLNGRPVQAHPLRVGDVLQVGRARIEVCPANGSEAAVAEVAADPDPVEEAGAQTLSGTEPDGAVATPDAAEEGARGPRIEVTGGPRAGHVYPLDRAWVALGEAGAELAVVTEEGAGHAVRGIGGFGPRLLLGEAPLDDETRHLADGDRLTVGALEMVYRAG